MSENLIGNVNPLNIDARIEKAIDDLDLQNKYDAKGSAKNVQDALDLYKTSNNLSNQELSNRIDNLVLNSGDSPAEVTDAHLDANGKAYNTLKERLDTENSELKSDLNHIAYEVSDSSSTTGNKFYNVNVNTTDTYKFEILSGHMAVYLKYNDTTVETITADAYAPFQRTFKSSGVANKLQVYYADTGSFRFQNISKRLPIVEEKTSTAERNVRNIDYSLDTIPHNYPDGINAVFHLKHLSESKIKMLKNLKFNTVFVYNQIEELGEIATLTKYIDTLYENDINVILQADATKIINGDADEIGRISAIKNHPALVGFFGYDEPAGHQVSKSNQITFYEKMKEISDLPIFQAENDANSTTLNSYFTRDSFDILVVDVYVNYDSSYAPDVELFGRLSIFINNPFVYAEHILPTMPLFYGDGFTKPTDVILKTYAKVFGSLGFRSKAVFAFDISDNSHGDIYTDSDLFKYEKLYSLYQSKTKNAKFIMPDVFDKASCFYESSNVQYNSSGFKKIGLEGSSGNHTVTYKVNSDANDSRLLISYIFRQTQDANTRKVYFDYSYDNATWTNFSEHTYGTLPAGYSNYVGCDIQPNKEIYVRARVETTGIQYAEYVGFTSINIITI